MILKRIAAYLVFCLIALWVADDVLRGLGYIQWYEGNPLIYVSGRDITVPVMVVFFGILLTGFFLVVWHAQNKGEKPAADAHEPTAELASAKEAVNEEIYRQIYSQVVGKPSSIEIPVGGDESAVSSKRFYQCPDCGAIHFKDTTILELVQVTGAPPSGGSTCSECGTRSDAGDIYSGSLDLSADDELIDQMLADPDNVSNDAAAKVWFYKKHSIYGPASSR